jgi:hypothetical protein
MNDWEVREILQTYHENFQISPKIVPQRSHFQNLNKFLKFFDPLAPSCKFPWHVGSYNIHGYLFL